MDEQYQTKSYLRPSHRASLKSTVKGLLTKRWKIMHEFAFMLLFVLSIVDLTLTFANFNKPKSWEYQVGMIGFAAPLILFGIKTMDPVAKIGLEG